MGGGGVLGRSASPPGIAPSMVRLSSTEEISGLQGLSITPKASASTSHRRTSSRSAAIALSVKGMRPLQLDAPSTPALFNGSSPSGSGSGVDDEDEMMVITPTTTPSKTPTIAGSKSKKSRDSGRTFLTSEEDEGEMSTSAKSHKGLFGDTVVERSRSGVVDGYKALKAALRCSSATSATAVAVNDNDLFSTAPIPVEAGDMIIGREEEKQLIWTHITGQPATVIDPDAMDLDETVPLNEKSPSRALYISGQPGTGKTALVSSLAARIVKEQEWKVAFVNCMGLAGKGGEEVWKRLAEGWNFDVTSRKKSERVVEDELRAAQNGQSSGL